MSHSRFAANVCSLDPLAAALEERIRSMEADGYGKLVAAQETDGISLTFGAFHVRAENYDIALVRLAGEILDDAVIGNQFMARIRSVHINSH